MDLPDLSYIHQQQRIFAEHQRRAENMVDAAVATLQQASAAVSDIIDELQHFEANLDPAEEARIVVIGGPSGTAIFLEGIAPRGHDRILFSGMEQDGCRVSVMQHVSQLNLMFKAVKVGEKKARRIGFHSAEEE